MGLEIVSKTSRDNWRLDIDTKRVAHFYKEQFDGYTEGEVHEVHVVTRKIEHDMALGTLAAMILLNDPETTELHGVMWGWMGLEKRLFISEVTEHAKLAIGDEHTMEIIETQVHDALATKDWDFRRTVYVPEIAITKGARGKGYYQKMVGELARIVTEEDSQNFVFWVQKDRRAYVLFQKSLGAELLAELPGPGERALMWGSSEEVFKRYGVKIDAVAA